MKLFYAFNLFTFIFLFSLNSHSKNGFEKGYIVTNEKDTIYGTVKDRKLGTFNKLYTKIIFKSEKGRKRKYAAKDILAYKSGQNEFESLWFLENSYFFDLNASSIDGKGKKLFFKTVIKGYLNYYYLEYVEENGSIDYSGYFKRENEGKMLFVRTGLFGLNKKQLISYFNDCPVLQNKIANKSFTNPYEIVAFYNQWVLSNKRY